MIKVTSVLKTVLMAGLLSAGSSWAYEHGDIIVRGGLTTVVPNDDSSAVTVDGVGNVGMAAEVNNNTQLGLNFVYMLDANLAIEVLAATPFSHDIKLVNTTDNALGLGDGKLANTKHLPPTISLLYYFDTATALKPYLGAGLNYTVFFDEKFAAPRQVQSFSNLSLDNSWGLAVQVGFDYELDKNWLLNTSLRYIDIDTEAKFDVLNTTGKVAVDIDPWVFSLMIGYKY
ncbi:OmpW/AlkL family protein [Flavobacterium sp. W21_SRS_FM6]|uniref:OmpW/AlkL family protein n=1 Tax=Flavobacterium sp. W21_SRS_FM6 TaxID=3240268 RepID=UPI003F8EFFCD